MTTFISSSLLLAMPCFALAPNRLMLAVVTSPHGSATALVGAATLSQAHFIQPGRALEAEFQVKSSFRKFYSYTCSFVSHQNHRLQARVPFLLRQLERLVAVAAA